MLVAQHAFHVTILVCYFRSHGSIGFGIVHLPIHATQLAFLVIILIPLCLKHGFIGYEIIPLPFLSFLHFRYPDSLHLNWIFHLQVFGGFWREELHSHYFFSSRNPAKQIQIQIHQLVYYLSLPVSLKVIIVHSFKANQFFMSSLHFAQRRSPRVIFFCSKCFPLPFQITLGLQSSDPIFVFLKIYQVGFEWTD